MKAFLDEYQDAMRRTWFVGVVGSCIVLLAAFREVAKFFRSLFINEVPFSSEIAQREMPAIGLAIIVGLIAVFRSALLVSSKQRPYNQSVASWIYLATSLLVYIWLVSPSSKPPPGCTESNICFGIYDMSDLTNFLAFAGVFFIVFSIVRAASTAIYVVAKYRYK